MKESGVEFKTTRKIRKNNPPSRKIQQRIKFILDNPQKGLTELSRILGVSKQCLQRMCVIYGVPYYKRERHILTEKQKQYIEENFIAKNIQTIAKELDVKKYILIDYLKTQNKNIRQIRTQARIKELMDIIGENANKSIKAISEITGKKENTLRDFCEKHNIKFKRIRRKTIHFK